jgi:methyl-accepting chemotaxis protein
MKGRFAALAGLALLGICAMAALAIRANEVNQHSLYNQNIESLVILQRLQNQLLEIRFHAAGVLLDQLPIQGSLNHLREARKDIAGLWAQLEPRGEDAFTDGDALEQFKQLKTHWGLVDATLVKLEQCYLSQDKSALTGLLEDGWPTLQIGAIKPLQSLIPITQKAATVAYETAIEKSRLLLAIGLATATACLVSLSILAWLTLSSLLKALRQVERSMGQIASGDLATPVPSVRHGEVGRMVAALTEMQQHLQGIVREVRQSTGRITTASTEIAAGSVDLSHRTDDAAAKLQQAASSLEQLTGTVRQSADAAQHASQLASSAAAVAERGGEVVSRVVTTMGEIDLSSRKISEIIAVIDGIAFQTNLLALNAAVEAARAGEQGRGFAIVASEVRSLAQRSSAAAQEIKLLIGTSAEKVNSGSKLVADAGVTMTELVASVRSVSDLIGKICVVALEQSERIVQVNTSVTQIGQVQQQNATLVEQSAAGAESLKEQAQRLAQVVGTFRLESGTARPTVPPVAAAGISRAPARSFADDRTTIAKGKPASSPQSIRAASNNVKRIGTRT